MVVGNNTLSLRNSIIAEVREQQQPVLEAAAQVDSINTRLDDVEASTASAVAIADRVGTQLFDTRAYASVQATINAAAAAGGGTVFVAENPPSGLDVIVYDGVNLTGRGMGATKWSVRSITGSGTVTALPALAVNASARTRTIVFASNPNLVAGDVLVIDDQTASSWNTARTYYQAGEFCKVSTVAANTPVAGQYTVTLSQPLYGGTYLTTNGNLKFWKLNPIRTGISNMEIVCQQGVYTVDISYGSNLVFENLKMSGTDWAHICVSRCYDVTVRNVSIFDSSSDASGYNYGLIIEHSQRVRVSDSQLETRRHGFTTSGEGVAGSICRVPNRDIIVSNSFINGLSTVLGVCGCNLHGNSEFVRFENCTMPSGVNPAGDFISYDNCDIGTPPWGSAVSCMEMLGTSLTFNNCRFRATDTHDANRGLIYLFFPSTAVRGGTLTFTNNTVDLVSATSDSTIALALYVLHQGATDALTRTLIIKNNMFEAITMTNRRACRINSTNAGIWNYIDFVDNTGRISSDFDFTTAGTSVYFEGWGTAVPAFTAQRGSHYFRRVTAGASTGKLYMNENGDTTWTVK